MKSIRWTVGLLAIGLSGRPLMAGSLVTEVQYFHHDGLGSVRAVSDAKGQLVTGESRDYLAFGEEWCGTAPCAGVTAGQPKRFTGKERDAETGLDYFGARYYGARLARFTTIDPVIDQKASLANPQLWNRYAYGRNNSLRYVDPDGRLTFVADPASKEPVSEADIQRAKDAQRALRESLTQRVKAYFRNQFAINLETLLADDAGPVVRLSRGTLGGNVGECKNGPDCGIRLNLDYRDRDLQAGMLHELGHHLERAGGKTYPNTIFDQRLQADHDRAMGIGGGYAFNAPRLLFPDERASYYGELYQFNEVRTFWAISER